MNLESQKTKLTLEFKGYVMRIRQFLEQNRRFADRCLNRVKMISNEIVTEQELAAQAEDEEASGEAASGEAADPTTTDAATTDAAAATADAS